MLQMSNELSELFSPPPPVCTDKRVEFPQKQVLATCDNFHPGIAARPIVCFSWVISDCVLDVFGGESPINRLYQKQFLMTAAGVSVAPS